MKRRRKKKNEKALPMRLLNALIYTKISLTFFAIGLVGLIMLVFFKGQELGTNGMIDRLYFILLIPLALGTVVQLFKVCGAEAWFEGKVWGGTLKLGGSVAAFALILFLGFELLPENNPFDFTIFLKDSSGKTVLKNNGLIKISLASDIRTKKINENGSVDFKIIPPYLQSKSVQVELEAKGWQFTNGKVSTDCILKGNNATLIIERDNSLCCVSGTVLDDDGNFVVKAKVTIKNISTETNENGLVHY
ncbi:MAG: hypothetical protein GTO45_14380 [Candidatus Aminicenantes bacterium]|nr:hypothetical protein [Candidatus Aminicenantes bacterium]NIM79953.1 hypothetical protein [Candidatus Aminicenantes bacterium]NIN19292.1 hypothetical protein [Candidatus Aminicenantes bacterium]NIN43195.1 hypothetical protein [Candidatus Aminicenantes bacterium]NIN85934.1 hypothetical protein [Candidatus Aminicenantes bacterium]